jgi:hypothetical protein
MIIMVMASGRLFFMISDFLRRRGLFRTADCLSGELEMDTAAAFLGLSQQIPGLMHSPAGFLAEWFAVFWELYAAHQTLKPTPTGNAKVASPPPPVMVPEQEAANKKLLLQRLMASVGLGNQEFAVLTADEKRLVNHLLSRYSPPANASMLSTSGASPNVKRLRTMVPPPERKPSVSSNIQTGGHLANLTSGTEPRPRSNSISSSSGQSPAFDGFHHVHSHPHHGSHQRISSNLIMSPDELMASLVQPQTTFNPSSLPELPGTGNSSSSKDSPLLSDLLRVKAQWGPFADKPSCLAYSGEQQLLAVGFRSGTVHILDPEGVKLPIELPHLHAQCTTQVRWRGAKLAAASLDKSVKLVDFGTSALSVFAVHTLNGHQAPVYAVEFVDDHSLCSCDGDGVLITWSLKDFTFRQTSVCLFSHSLLVEEYMSRVCNSCRRTEWSVPDRSSCCAPTICALAMETRLSASMPRRATSSRQSTLGSARASAFCRPCIETLCSWAPQRLSASLPSLTTGGGGGRRARR